MAGVILAAGAGAWAGPEKVAPEAWSRIAPQLERTLYEFQPQGTAFTARNRAQDFRLAADRAGVAVADRVRLRAISVDYGTGAQTLPDAAPVSVGSRVAYRRGPVTEWYENRAEGLEQGFQIKGDRCQDSGVGGRGSGFRVQGEERTAVATMALEVEVATELAVAVAEGGQAIHLKDTAGNVKFRYGGLKVIDATGRLLPSSLQSAFRDPHSALIRLVFDAAGAQFPITIDPVLTSMEKKLLASDGAAGDVFGSAVAAAGDVVVVGAYYDNDMGNFSGSAYVFERNAGGTNAWGQVKKLTAADGAANDQFGFAVAAVGDVIVVGAFADDVSTNADQGSAYVFERNAGGTNAWSQIAKLIAADGAANDQFGFAVAAAGDVIIVGAYGDDDFGGESGSAYVFERNAGGTNAWGQVRKLIAADGVADDRFGLAVAADGDVIAVGAALANAPVADAGSAYVFERNAGGTNAWGQVAKLTAADGATDDRFGSAVAVAGDAIVIGAEGDDDLGNWSGSVYVFERNAGGTNAWGQVRKLTAADGAANNYFGAAVGVAGDRIVVGAWRNRNASVDTGSAYVFERNAGGTNAWGQVQKFSATDGASGDQFGSAVAAAGDVIVIGAQYDDDLGDSSGSAYVYPVQTTDWNQTRKLTAADGATNDYFGGAAAVAGDVIVAGACHDDVGTNTDQGSIYVFERDAGGTNAWGQVKKLTASDGSAYDYFGYWVAVAGDVIAVGAVYDDVGTNTDQGSAYVFERNAGGTNAWEQVKKLTALDGAAEDWFGTAAAAAGDVIVVGACGDDDLGNASGSAYVFERNAGGTNAWGQVKKLTALDGAAGDWFGWVVAVAGDVIAVGACYNGGSLGSAYIFERNAGGANVWGQVKKLVALDGAAGDCFGCSVAVAGDVIAVGACYDDDLGDMSGSAYVFERNAGGANAWGQVKKLLAADGAAYDYFGWPVTAAGDVIVVGADADDVHGRNDQGSAYVFERNTGGTNAWGQAQKLTAADGAADDWFGMAVAAAGDVIAVGASDDDDMGAESGSAYVFEGVLYGSPTITSVSRTGGACGLGFDSQPAWRYDVQCRTNLLTGQWDPAGGLTNLPGHVSGATGVMHTNAWPRGFYRVRRH
jgi:hypothetical protein